MKLALIGTGYVGLTTGVGFAFLGHEVTCIDTDAPKIGRLKQGLMPFYEPWLAEMFDLVNTNLQFCSSYEALASADVVFITVGTPSLPDGSSDLSYVRGAAQAVGRHLKPDFTVIVNKSTVPIGSGNWVDTLVREAFAERHGAETSACFAVASNPEFLREGSALHDSLYPDRVVIGSEDRRAIEAMHRLYRPILEQTFAPPSFLPRPESLGAVPLIATDLQSAELVKYAANAFLSLKISYINEIANLAERVGADITQVAKGIGLDRRIGTQFLQAGLGWGGSCFGKDTAALMSTGAEYSLEMPIVAASRHVNYRQRERVVERLLEHLKILKGRCVGLLGIAFKPQTDDIRDSPALDIAARLAQRGATVKLHDPVALDRARAEVSTGGIHFCETAEAAACGADALVLVTDWSEYRELSWEAIAPTMRNRLIVDGRNFLPADRLERAGFRYVGIGR
jgi:UDPglucose 6-dehydrogenase